MEIPASRNISSSEHLSVSLDFQHTAKEPHLRCQRKRAFVVFDDGLTFTAAHQRGLYDITLLGNWSVRRYRQPKNPSDEMGHGEGVRMGTRDGKEHKILG